MSALMIKIKKLYIIIGKEKQYPKYVYKKLKILRHASDYHVSTNHMCNNNIQAELNIMLSISEMTEGRKQQ